MSAVSEEDVLAALVLWWWWDGEEDAGLLMGLDDELGIPPAVAEVGQERVRAHNTDIVLAGDETCLRWEVEKAERAVVEAALLFRDGRRSLYARIGCVRYAVVDLLAARRALEGR